MYKEAFKFDLDTSTRKPAEPPSLPAACLVAVGMSPNNGVHYQAFLKHGFSVLDIKPVMIVTN